MISGMKVKERMYMNRSHLNLYLLMNLDYQLELRAERIKG
jgi:hypothetical protein